MSQALATNTIGPVDNGPEVDQRAAAIKARREEHGMDVIDLAKLAGVDRGRLAGYEKGAVTPREPWIRRVERALDDFEEEVGLNAPTPISSPNHVVRFEVKGVYGADALVVEGPIEDIAELEEAVDRIMRRIQGRGEITAHIEQPE